MIVATVLEKRQHQWAELETLCTRLEVRGRAGRGDAETIARFASLYRAACADLALADAYQLPPATVAYLHRLVARAHNNLYRTSRIDPGSWGTLLLQTAPRQIFADSCVRVAAGLFFGLFTLAMLVAFQADRFPEFASQVVGVQELGEVEKMYEAPIQGSLDHYVQMAAFYIRHNTGIGLKCFAFGILIVPCLITLAVNAVMLGTVFGHMASLDSEAGDHFLHFVTAHGPFELTAIALAAGAGLRLGIGLFATGGLTRVDSLYRSARAAVPVVVASATLFFLAALTEGFISPSPLPYLFKAFWAIGSSGLISFYFVVLGFPPDALRPAADEADSPAADPLAADPVEVGGAA